MKRSVGPTLPRGGTDGSSALLPTRWVYRADTCFTARASSRGGGAGGKQALNLAFDPWLGKASGFFFKSFIKP